MQAASTLYTPSIKRGCFPVCTSVLPCSHFTSAFSHKHNPCSHSQWLCFCSRLSSRCGCDCPLITMHRAHCPAPSQMHLSVGQRHLQLWCCSVLLQVPVNRSRSSLLAAHLPDCLRLQCYLLLKIIKEKKKNGILHRIKCSVSGASRQPTLILCNSLKKSADANG